MLPPFHELIGQCSKGGDVKRSSPLLENLAYFLFRQPGLSGASGQANDAAESAAHQIVIDNFLLDRVQGKRGRSHGRGMVRSEDEMGIT